MNIIDLIDGMTKHDECDIAPPNGVPTAGEGLSLPEDVEAFYGHCGGAVLFRDSPYQVRIVGPDEVIPINIKLYSGVDDTLLAASLQDRSASWYIIADMGNGNYTSIDLDHRRLGKCYDSSFEGHGVAGSCPIVAESFSEYLYKTLANGGDYWYWLKPSFLGLGDAYDDPT